MIQTLLHDLHYGFRSLRKQPGFTLIAVLALGLGIGATTAIFSLINSVMLRPLPFEQPEHLVALGQTYPQTRSELASASYSNFADWRAQNRSFEQMTAYYPNAFTLTGEGQPQRLTGAVVTSDFFPMLRVKPLIGRVFEPADDQTGGGKEGRPVILSWHLWQKNFGGDPQILGRRLQLSGSDYTVVGVMPAGFSWPIAARPMELWTSIALDAEQTNEGSIMKSRGYCTWAVMGRLKASVTAGQARAELATIADGLAKQFPENNKDVGIDLKPVLDELTGTLSYSLRVLFGAVICVLLIACTNVASLLTVRAAGRRREIAVRAALGASHWRIVRQLLTESVLLSVAGGALGLLIAFWGADGLRALAPEGIPRLNEMGIDWRVLLFTSAVSLITGIIFGLAPAVQSARPDLNTVFKDSSGNTTDGRRRQRFRSLLVITELALSLVLLTGAGLLLQSFLRVQRVDPGFNPHNLLTFNVEVSGERFEKPEPTIAFFHDLQERLKALPGVSAVSMASFLPFSGDDPTTGFEIRQQPLDPAQQPVASLRIIGNDYFSTMGIALRQGREFTPRDTLNAPAVVLINEAFAKKFFPAGDAIGRRLKPSFSTYGTGNRDFEIVGIVGDVRHDSLKSQAQPEFYFASAQMPFGFMTMIVRGEVNARTLIPAATNLVTELDRNTPLYGVRTLDEYIARSLSGSRLYMTLLTIFAGLALLLAAVGLYGLIAYSVAQRRQEIGIRMALGAEGADIFRLIIGQGMKLTLTGIAIGLLLSLAVTRVLQNLLFGVTATDAMTFALVTLLLTAVALVACWIPALRAMRTDPMIALRTE